VGNPHIPGEPLPPPPPPPPPNEKLIYLPTDPSLAKQTILQFYQRLRGMRRNLKKGGML
jgi:hypothetical protein